MAPLYQFFRNRFDSSLHRGLRTMSTPEPTPGNPPVAPLPASSAPSLPVRREILIISHSSMFYWWPVWAAGFLMFIVTAISHEYLVTVPPGTTAVKGAFKDEKGNLRDAFVLPVETSGTSKLRMNKEADLSPEQP